MPVKRIKSSQLASRVGSRLSSFERMVEWREIAEAVSEGLCEGDGLEVSLCKESQNMSEQVDFSQVLNRFSARFRKLFPPKEFRYEMYTKAGLIWVRGTSQQRKLVVMK